MLNIAVARKAVAEVNGHLLECRDTQQNELDAIVQLHLFIDSVERLIKYNAIKQVPVLFEPKKGD